MRVECSECTYWVTVQALVGIKALEIQLPDDISIPDSLDIRLSTLGSLLMFNRGQYVLPERHTILIYQLIGADKLGFDVFLEYVSFVCRQLDLTCPMIWKLYMEQCEIAIGSPGRSS